MVVGGTSDSLLGVLSSAFGARKLHWHTTRIPVTKLQVYLIQGILHAWVHCYTHPHPPLTTLSQHTTQALPPGPAPT
jgi:hypothetical protein